MKHNLIEALKIIENKKKVNGKMKLLMSFYCFIHDKNVLSIWICMIHNFCSTLKIFNTFSLVANILMGLFPQYRLHIHIQILLEFLKCFWMKNSNILQKLLVENEFTLNSTLQHCHMFHSDLNTRSYTHKKYNKSRLLIEHDGLTDEKNFLPKKIIV